MLLTSRKLLQSKLLDIEDELRGTLKNFGLKVGPVSKRQCEARIRELVEPHRWLAAIVEPILVVRTTLRVQTATLHKMLLGLVRDDPVCRRFLTVPRVGAVVAMTYRATIDVPARFAKSRSVGVHCGLIPRKCQSGEIDWTERISKCGDEMLRVALYEAAQVLMTRSGRWSSRRLVRALQHGASAQGARLPLAARVQEQFVGETTENAVGATRSSASRRISFSKIFLPSRRCSSRT
jgi:transposase